MTSRCLPLDRLEIIDWSSTYVTQSESARLYQEDVRFCRRRHQRRRRWAGVTDSRTPMIGRGSRPSVPAAAGTTARPGSTGNYGSGKEFPKYGDLIAVCDADSDRRRPSRSTWSKTGQVLLPKRSRITEPSLTVTTSTSCISRRRIIGTPRSRSKRCCRAKTSTAKNR